MAYRTRFVRLCLAYLRAQGRDPAPLVTRLSLPADAESAESLELPLPRMGEVAEAVAAELGDPDLGLHLALITPRGTYGVAEYIATNSATLGQGWGAMVRFSALLSNEGVRTLELTDTELHFELRVPGHPLAYGRHANEFDLLRMLHISRQQTGAPLLPRRLWFAHPRPASTELLTHLFGVEPEFGCGSCGIALDRASADLPFASADPALGQLLAAHAQVLEERLEVEHDLVAQVQQAMKTGLKHGGTSLEAVAVALHMSGRTLQRKLAERGKQFGAVLEELRRSEASRYLNRSRLTVTEIAFVLGYSDVSTFVRAFRGWTGQTPSEFREAQVSA